MIYINLLILFVIVIIGVFISGWFTPLIIVFINRLLLDAVDPFLILFICMISAIIGDILLWKFDKSIHLRLDKKLHRKKPKTITKHNKGIVRQASNRLWDKMQILDNKVVLFIGVFFASFSVIPDFFIVEFSRKKFKVLPFSIAMFFGKFMVYAPLIRGSIGIIELIKFSI